MEQWFGVKVASKATSKIILRYTTLSFTTTWIGKNEPDSVTVKVAVICCLSSTPLIGTVFEPFKSNIYFLGKLWESGNWSRLSASSSEVSWSETNFEIAHWKVNFPCSKNLGEGSTLPVVLFVLPNRYLSKHFEFRPQRVQDFHQIHSKFWVH